MELPEAVFLTLCIMGAFSAGFAVLCLFDPLAKWIVEVMEWN